MTDTSKDLVVQSTAYSRANLTERQQYVAMLARAGDLLPEKLRGQPVKDPNTGQLVQMGNVGKTFLLAETGDMLGIHPMAAMTGVHIIEGKPSISANLMGGLVRKAGHKLRVTVTGDASDKTLKATAQLIRQDDPDFTFEVTWTVADAERAGLWPGKPGSNWAKYPKAMMKARVISEIVREAAPDVLMGGNVYTPEELGVAVTEEGEPIDLQEVRPQPQAAPQQRPQAPIVDPQPEPQEPVQGNPEGAAEPPAEEYPYAEKIAEAKTVEDVREIFRHARSAGDLGKKIKQGRKTRTIEEILVEVGKSMNEVQPEVPAEPEGEDSAPAVLAEDPNVVDAEVVED